MPLYEYYCGHCGKEFDLRRQASDAGEPGRCPVCGTEADRLVSAFASKVGFYLDQHREGLMVEERHLTALRSQSPRQPHYVDRRGSRDGSLVTDWNLIVPTEAVERSWAEVT